MKKTIIYCYDAYCGWCYGFSPVMNKMEETYREDFNIEVLSGGMITGEQVLPVARFSALVLSGYKRVEELSGVKFGEDYLWHFKNPEVSDWQLNSEKPAIALCIFKEYYPQRQLEFASDLQYALHAEGRDLDDKEAYRHLLEKYSIQPEAFYKKMESEEYKDLAQYEFALCKQLQVTGFPSVLLQMNESKFYLLARGYTSYADLQQRIENVLRDAPG